MISRQRNGGGENMKLTIEAEPKEISELLQKPSPEKRPELVFVLDSTKTFTTDWNKQSEFIKKISAQYSDSCNLRIIVKLAEF